LLRHKILKAADYKCSECNKKKDEKDLAVHHINEFETLVVCTKCHRKIHFGKNRIRQRRFYVPNGFRPTLEKFEKILKREGSNLSKWFRQQATDYVRRHEPGNPQQLLTRYDEENQQPYVAPRPCAMKFCPNPAAGTAFNIPSGKEWALCRRHLESIRNSSNWTLTKKKVGV